MAMGFRFLGCLLEVFQLRVASICLGGHKLLKSLQATTGPGVLFLACAILTMFILEMSTV